MLQPKYFNNFQTTINKTCKLDWISSPLSDRTVALDYDIWIDLPNKSIKHKSYTKEQNLFLHSSPNSAHSPNTLDGMAHRMIEKHWMHFSDPVDCKQEIYLLHQRILNVGHNPTKLNLIFAKESKKLHKKINQKGLIK